MNAVVKKPRVICLMGPTAAGKTPLAVKLVQNFPCEIISVDSAMVYKHMDIGTAKPDAEILKIAPHRLINLVDPSEAYSAGRFRVDALEAIEEIIAQGKIPLLVGGTMLYFRVLQQGIASLPKADTAIRAALTLRAKENGWSALHAELACIDPQAAERINVNDAQRIQRALEVFQLSGKTISALQAADTNSLSTYEMINLAITPEDRARLHERIALRFQQMLDLGFMAEVECLYKRGDLSPQLPAIRSVGYAQAWDYLAGSLSHDDMREKAIAATRQLAKRQLTWLRSWQALEWFDSEADTLYEQIAKRLLAYGIK
jgi:tRNA dimethylallyltransferase